MSHPPTLVEMFVAQGLSEDAACTLACALQLLVRVPTAELERGIETIGRMESVGPLFDPSFFVRNPKAFDNATANREVLQKALALRKLLPADPIDAILAQLAAPPEDADGGGR